jgi:5,10-methylene-tetrahydrofolate dehydrogenase/methenyl tetrahydrofolate cyclohydrolase
MATLIDGKATAATIQEEIRKGIEELRNSTGIVPGLGVVLVGNRPDSATYVRMKEKAAKDVGINFVLRKLDSNITQYELVSVVRELNADSSIHGIIVQLPLPSHINEKTVLQEVSLEKDADGFHPLNIGALALKGHTPLFIPGTPRACIELLERNGIQIDGKRAVVLGRSNIVGMPVALLLMHRNATVTICHSRTRDIAAICREADIIIAAIGQPEMVKRDWVKPGAVVIDVGINSVPDALRKSGTRLVGDVAFEEVKEVAGAITPVPGGVGPMTVCMLLLSTFDSAKRFASRSSS